MASILAIEDEKDLLQILDYNLREAGYSVLLASTGQAGADLARAQKPDLILLDIMLPDRSGLDVCRALKADAATSAIPVIMVTAKGEEIDRVVGFELGADDYVVKPFSVRELLLRVQVVLRRGQGGAPQVDDRQLIQFGVLRIDRAAHRVWVGADEVPLTPLEFKLLVTLYERRNRVQSRATLLDDVWGASQENVTRTIDTHVKRLREKLGEEAGSYVETVRGVGYRFTGCPPEGRPPE
jgi:two-component system phosphate regulon response regulator PhoB